MKVIKSYGRSYDAFVRLFFCCCCCYYTVSERQQKCNNVYGSSPLNKQVNYFHSVNGKWSHKNVQKKTKEKQETQIYNNNSLLFLFAPYSYKFSVFRGFFLYFLYSMFWCYCCLVCSAHCSHIQFISRSVQYLVDEREKKKRNDG